MIEDAMRQEKENNGMRNMRRKRIREVERGRKIKIG